MFIENQFAVPLFDFEKGGPPKAWKCLLQRLACIPCNKVTRTERGMRMHLKTVHNWKEQPCLFSMESPTEHGSQESRKQLRISPKPRKSGDVEPKADKVTQETMSTKSPETNEGDLLKLMNEEK